MILAPAHLASVTANTEAGGEVRRTPTAPTAHTLKPKKTRKTADLVLLIRGRF
jgi:hypothetical protein